MDKVAPFYDKICSPCSNERIDYLKKFIKDNHITTFLDLSCSTGQTIDRLQDCDCCFFGIDLSTKMIKVAKTKIKPSSNIHFYHDDMVRFLKNTARKFDCIYSNSLNWLPNLDIFSVVLQLCADKLTTNGILLIDIPIDGEISHHVTSNYIIDDSLIIKNTLMTNISPPQVNVIQQYTLITEYSHTSYLGKFSLINFDNKLLCDTINKSPLYIAKRDINYNHPSNILYHQLTLKKRNI